MSNTSNKLENSIQGMWWLISLEDYTLTGEQRTDPVLGSDPLAVLVYAHGYFSAQFMKKDRNLDSVGIATGAGRNNTSAIGGYDAYFGTYKIDETTGQVAHTLLGSINPSNVGITVYRTLTVENSQLIIRLETTTSEGEAVTRTLKWKRIEQRD